MTNLEHIIEGGVVAALRAPSSEKLIKVCEALFEGGLKSIEVTMTTPNALKVIEEAADKMGDKVLIGVGTVLDPETARSAILAGAEYIVAPTLNLKVIEMAKRYSKLSFPGALTPTEILTAWEAGADIVKVFPAAPMGPRYVKDILGPLPHILLMPTGGITVENCGEYIEKGACCVTAAGDLLPKQALEDNRFDIIVERAKKMRENILKARGLK